MKNISNKAVTLIELIVSLMLVSIVVLGIYSISMVLNINNQDYGQRYLVRSETQATLDHILNNASLAWTNSSLDPAIVTGVSGNTTFCIHQPPTNNIIGSANVNGIWLCYTLSNYQINWCAETYSLGGAASCSTAGDIIPFNGNNTTFLGTAYSITNPAPTFTTTAGFSVTIQNCLNDSASGCNSSGTSTLPATNPEVQVSGSVFPSQVSTG